MLHTVRAIIPMLLLACTLAMEPVPAERFRAWADAAVNVRLDWLAQHIQADGGWTGESRSRAAGMAVLAFLGSGYDHKTPNKYRKVLSDGVRFLLDRSAEARDQEDLAWIVLALAEAYAMSVDVNLKVPTQQAFDRLVGQARSHPQGWTAWVKEGVWDADPTILAILAAKSVHAGGLEVRGVFESGKVWWQSWAASGGFPLRVSRLGTRAGDAQLQGAAAGRFLGLGRDPAWLLLRAEAIRSWQAPGVDGWLARIATCDPQDIEIQAASMTAMVQVPAPVTDGESTAEVALEVLRQQVLLRVVQVQH